MHVGMPIQETPRALEARDSTRDGGPGSGGALEKFLERLIGKASEVSQSFPATEEGAEPPRERNDHVPVRDGLEDLRGDELPECHLAFGVARGAEAALFAGEGKDVSLSR